MMKTRISNLVLAVAAVVAALALSVSYWPSIDVGVLSRPTSIACLVLGGALAIYVLCVTAADAYASFGNGGASYARAANAARSGSRAHPAVPGLAAAIVMIACVELFNYGVLKLSAPGAGAAPVTVAHGVNTLVIGLVVAVGAVLVGFEVLALRHRGQPIPASTGFGAQPETELRSNYPSTGWSRYLVGPAPVGPSARRTGQMHQPLKRKHGVSSSEAGLWLLAVWLFAAIIMVCVGSFGVSVASASVALHQPHVLIAAGSTGLLLAAVGFASRCLVSMHVHGRVAPAGADALAGYRVGSVPTAGVAANVSTPASRTESNRGSR